MTGSLPESLEIAGEQYRIDSDFRNILTVCQALCDPELTDTDRLCVTLRRLYTDPVESVNISEAAVRAFWFIGGGDIPHSEPEPGRIIDWGHDEHIIMPAVSRVLGVTDIRTLPHLHWWTFLGAFGEVGEGLLSEVIHIRQKLARGKRLEKYEREFLRRNKGLIVLRTPEEAAEIAETEAFLRELI